MKKIRILFVLEKTRKNKKGLCPLKCRLTYRKKRKQFSTGLFIDPDDWLSKKQKTVETFDPHINNQISLIRQKLHRAFLFLQVNEEVFDVEDIYLKYKGENTSKNKTIIEVFDLHNKRMKRLIGSEYSESTYKKFLEAKMHTKNFIQKVYHRQDYLLKNIKLKFLDDLDYYLKTEKNHKQITINKTIQRVRKIIKIAIAEGFLDRDPFLLYKPKKVIQKIIYLSPKELYVLESFTFKQKRLQQVKDMFVFCCYTGLAYAEMNSLCSKHLVEGFDGNTWIRIYRQKTNSILSIPLLKKAKDIIAIYKNDNRILPMISNQKFNSYLKEISDIVGIEKRLTHHVARKTFATTVLLSNNVSMEIVSELLGHSNLEITQKHYAKVIQRSVSNVISQLDRKLLT